MEWLHGAAKNMLIKAGPPAVTEAEAEMFISLQQKICQP